MTEYLNYTKEELISKLHKLEELYNPLLALYDKGVVENNKAAAELILANKERVFQNEEKMNRSTELLIADKVNEIQNEEKEKRLIIEDSLRETNEYLENLFSYANAPIIVWDTKFNITRFNPAFELLTGRKAVEVIGHSIQILFPVDLVVSSMELIKKAQTGERLEIAEIKILHVNGSEKTVLWNSAPVLGADRKTIIEIIAQGQDITDRKLAEDSLRETNEYLENLLSYANAPIIVWDTKFNITRFNPAFELLTGRKAAEVIGHSIKILFPVDLVVSSMELIKKAQTGERLEIAEIKILHVNGSERTVLWNSAPVLGADRKTIIEIIAQGQDITDRKLAEDSSRETNEYLENLFSYANAPIIVWDTKFNITRFNPAFELLTGRKAAEVIGHSIQILFPVDLVESSMELIKKAQTGERLEITEIKILHENGSERTVLWNSAPVLGADRKTIIEIIAQGQDITDRKLAEDSLRETNEYLENLFSYANAPIIVWDIKFNITRFNPAFELLTGRKAAEVIGHSIEILFPNDFVESTMELLKHAQKGERLEIAEIKILHVNGSVRTVLWNSAPVIGGDGKTIIEIIAQGQDISERKQAESALRLLSNELEIIIDSIPGLVFYKDVNNHFIRVNKYMCDAYQMSKKQLEGIHLSELHSKELAQEYYDADLKVIASRKPELNIEEPWMTEGGLRWLNTSKVPYIDQTGEVVGVIGVSMDITERNLAQEELEIYRKHLEELVTERTIDLDKAVKNLEQSNKELEEFAYVASHDLQEPLRMVSSYTQLLERRYKDKLDQDANDFIHYAVDGASRMQKLINDLLDYSRVSSQGKEFAKIDCSQILGHAISNLQYLISENLALVTNEDLPVLNVDETQIVRVFQNLIENAIKYKKITELPKIHIACKLKNKMYEFSVSDNGLGIDMQYHDRIFIIFQRLHKKDEYPGTGIGLSVSKRIVERHGGSIWFESKKDEGTTFYFTIPE